MNTRTMIPSYLRLDAVRRTSDTVLTLKIKLRSLLSPRLLLLTPLLIAGCRFYQPDVPPAHYYYINRDVDLSTIGKIAFVQLNNNSNYPQISGEVTESLFQALQKKHFVGLSIIPQNHPAWRTVELDPDSSAYSIQELYAARHTLQADTILFGTITGYQPYPHMAVGLRLKIVSLADGRLLWALEQVWDTADKNTKNRIEDYYSSPANFGFTSLSEPLGTVSPIKFIKFVVYEVAETLRYER